MLILVLVSNPFSLCCVLSSDSRFSNLQLIDYLCEAESVVLDVLIIEFEKACVCSLQCNCGSPEDG